MVCSHSSTVIVSELHALCIENHNLPYFVVICSIVLLQERSSVVVRVVMIVLLNLTSVSMANYAVSPTVGAC